MKIDLGALIAALLETIARSSQDTASTPNPAPAPPQAPTGPVQPPPKPSDPLQQVKGLTVDLDLFLAEGVPCPYRVEEREDFYQIVKTDGTTNLPIHGGAYLHAGYLDAQGQGITFPPGSPLDHTAVWTMRRTGDQAESVWCGPGNPAKEGGSREVANFRLAEYERTRGMDVPVHFPPEADETIPEVVLTVGSLTSKPIRFPKIS